MAMTMHVDIVSAEDEIFSGTVEMIFAPAVMGEVGIAPRHAPMLTPMKAGEIRIKKSDGTDAAFFVSGGMLEVQPHVVTVLADTALRAKDIDEAAALEAKRSAEQLIQEGRDDGHAKAQLEEALAMLRVVEQMKMLKHGRKG